MEFSDQTIVLRLGGFRESDLWVRLLSPTRGVFSAFAFGGSKSRRRFSGCLDLFNEVHFHVKSSGQGAYLALQEGLLLKGPDKLRRDWRKLGIAVNCALFLESFCVNPDGAAQTHGLFAGLLNALESDLPGFPLLPIFFRARLAFEQGYALNPGHCSSCGSAWREDSQAVLPLSENGLICRDCASRNSARPLSGGFASRRFNLGAQSLAALRHILEKPVETWHAMPADEYSRKECARAVDAFLQFNTGLQWSNGRFRKA